MLFYLIVGFFFFKQKTAYEVRISDWSSDVCSSDLQVQVRNILLGDHDRRIDGDLRREAFARRSQARAACLGFHDRLFQHGLVKFEPDFLDMPGLLVTDQIARAANVEVMAGKLKTRAKPVEIGKHLPPLLRRLRTPPVGGAGLLSLNAGLGPPPPPP